MYRLERIIRELHSIAIADIIATTLLTGNVLHNANLCNKSKLFVILSQNCSRCCEECLEPKFQAAVVVLA